MIGCLTDGINNVVTPPTPVTPPKAGGARCISVENKLSHQPSEKQATLQLQANMVLTCAGLLTRRLRKDDICILTCYGLLIAPVYSIKMLKLTINFESGLFMFEELVCLSQHMYLHVYVDMLMEYVVKALSH